MDVRFCELGLKLEGTELSGRIDRLYRELASRGLRFRPPCWLSSEWFSPQGFPGIAIPFYLAHPRLKRLEYRQMSEAEGGTAASCMQLLRHEAGHAYQVAYRLNRQKDWRELFGPGSKPYPEHYSPKPSSRDYVLHLDWWYAQSHPFEDFAETFAVWLPSRSNWRVQYSRWPALRKLEYVDGVMSDIAGKPPMALPRRQMEPLSELRQTLREHYREKRKVYDMELSAYDRDLSRMFPGKFASGSGVAASAFLRHAGEKLERVYQENFQYVYALRLVLKQMTQRSRELALRAGLEDRAMREALKVLERRTKHLFHKKHRLAM